MFHNPALGLIVAGRITLWAYKTSDPLAEVLKSGYFTSAALQRGDRIEIVAGGDAHATVAVREPIAGKTRVAVLAKFDPADTAAESPRTPWPRRGRGPRTEPPPADAAE